MSESDRDLSLIVREDVAFTFYLDTDKITAETRFAEDLNADGLDLVELAMELEDSFDISVPTEDAEKWVTVADAIEYVQQAVATSPQ